MPSRVRQQVLLVTTIMSALLYLDRYCISFVEKLIQKDLALTDVQIGWCLSAFFWSYALAQVPAGWLNDRFGARAMMCAYVFAWSAFTGLTGLATGFVTLLAFRLGFGIAQAGAYPTASSLIGRWAPVLSRGAASGWVALGGRVGAAAAPILTAQLIAYSNWRAALILYGLLGIALGAVIWRIYRDSPRDHPLVDAEELAIIERGRDPAPTLTSLPSVPWRGLLTSGGMWLNCLSQLTTNFGWTFLVTWLARYLEEVHSVPIQQRSVMASAPLFVAWAGMLIGGRLTDGLTARYGKRWGRALPMSLSKFACALAYLGCLVPWSSYVPSEFVPWIMTLVFCAVAFCTDLGIASIWAYTQDIGGRNVGAVLGWGNMWGNLGAGLSPILLLWIVGPLAAGQTRNWDLAFAACAVSFFVSGLAALGVNATIPIREIAGPRMAEADH